jgi:hypothetical protein
MPVRRRVSDKPMMAVSIFAVDLKAYHKADSRYRVMMDIGEVSSNKKLTYTLAR